MTPEKILELAACNEIDTDSEFRWSFDKEDLIAFAQAIIEERESIGEPVAWIDHEGGLYHYKLYETYLPLYRHPPHKRKLTDEEIIQIGHAAGALEGNHMLPIAFARAIERRINGEKE
jgi:hypothetical protein